MKINGITISETRLTKLTAILANKVYSYMSKDNQHPSLVGNDEEGSTTGDEAKGQKAYAGKVSPAFGNDVGMPGILEKKNGDTV